MASRHSGERRLVDSRARIPVRKEAAISSPKRGFVVIMFAAAATLSCGTPAAPTAAAITDVRYEHVIGFSIASDMRVNLEYWNCGNGPRDGPSTCPLTRDQSGAFRCQDPSFMQYLQRVPTTCDSTVDVMIRSSTGNPLLQAAHDVYLNGTKVTRITSNSALGYLREFGAFRVDTLGRIE